MGLLEIFLMVILEYIWLDKMYVFIIYVFGFFLLVMRRWLIVVIFDLGCFVVVYINILKWSLSVDELVKVNISRGMRIKVISISRVLFYFGVF